MAAVKKLASEAELKALIDSTKSAIKVLDFSASWCGPCKKIKPDFDALAARLAPEGAVVFAVLDVDECEDLSEAYGVESLPSFVVLDAAGNKLELLTTGKISAVEALITKHAGAPPKNAKRDLESAPAAAEKADGKAEAAPAGSPKRAKTEAATAAVVELAALEDIDDFKEFTRGNTAGPASLAVVNFTASWCGPCQKMKPAVKAMAGELAGQVDFATVDVDDNEECATSCDVSSMVSWTFQLRLHSKPTLCN